VMSIVERRRVARDEAIELIAGILRQRHIGIRPRKRYVRPRSRRKSRGG
jgi:hypothetical protein